MAAVNKFFHGSTMLEGDNTVPGVPLPEDLGKLLPRIFQEVRDYGCDFFPTYVEMLTYDEISEIASYGGFPVRFPHWKWGMEFEELQRGYEYGMHRIYEMVINNDPCVIYCLNSNTLVDNVTVVCHALFHNDFFKNNLFFERTHRGMVNKMANHGTRIRTYMARWGKEVVTEFLDQVMRLETLIDPADAWDVKRVKEKTIEDRREYRHPARLEVSPDNDYMEGWINPASWIDRQRKDIARDEVAAGAAIFREPTKNILGYLRDHAPLKPWQQDIIAMLYEESIYFAPQRATKTGNEGHASWGDYKMMTERLLCGLGQDGEDCGIIEYSEHKWKVLGGKYSMNPYKLGFYLLRDIEERWNKGRFGDAYDECKDSYKREHWDTGHGKGREKVFEVRRYYNDPMLISEFFTQEFCEKNEFFEWKHYPNGEWRIENRDYKKIKANLISKYMNGGLPDLRLTDPNYRGKGHFFVQHQWDGRTLYESYIRPVLVSMYRVWSNDVYLATRDKNGQEVVWSCHGPAEDAVKVRSRDKLEAE